MLKEFGSEKLIGILHAFVLLRPVIDKAIRQREAQLLDITDLTKKFDNEEFYNKFV